MLQPDETEYVLASRLAEVEAERDEAYARELVAADAAVGYLEERDRLALEVERKDKVLYYIYDGFGEDNWITLAIYKVLHPEKPLQYDVTLVPPAPQRKFIGLSGASEPCEREKVERLQQASAILRAERSGAVWVCPECDIAGCKHYRAALNPEGETP